MPASWARWASSAKAFAVMAKIGTDPASAFTDLRMARAASYPSITDIMMSIRIASKLPAGPFDEGVECLATVRGARDHHTLIGMQRRRDLAVEVVVFREQHPHSRNIAFALGVGRTRMSLGRAIDFEREHDAERRALALDARDVDRAVHLLHEALHDGHSHAGALVVAACIAARLRERLENAPEELLCYPRSCSCRAHR